MLWAEFPAIWGPWISQLHVLTSGLPFSTGSWSWKFCRLSLLGERIFKFYSDPTIDYQSTMCEHLPVSRVVMYSISLLVCFACLYKAYGSATYRIKAPEQPQLSQSKKARLHQFCEFRLVAEQVPHKDLRLRGGVLPRSWANSTH